MDIVTCIFACGYMRNFVAPLVWRKREEDAEVVINARGRICDICGAIALDPVDANRVHHYLLQYIATLEGD